MGYNFSIINVQNVYIFVYLTTTFRSSNIQSSQVKLSWLNTLRDVPCSPPLAHLPSQPCMAVTGSLVLWPVQCSSGFSMH